MPPSDRDWSFRLNHILDALEKIRDYVEDMDFDSFEQDSKTIDACLRNLALIGEAARHLPSRITYKYPDVPWNEMRGLRNILIHEYFGVSMRIVWKTIERDLPILRRQILEIIGQEAPTGSSFEE